MSAARKLGIYGSLFCALGTLTACSSGNSQQEPSTKQEAKAITSQAPTQELTVEGLTMRLSSPYVDTFCDVVARLRNTGKTPVETPDFTIEYELNGNIVGSEQGLVERTIPVGGTAPLKMKHYCPPKGAKVSDLSAVTFYDKQTIRLVIKKR